MRKHMLWSLAAVSLLGCSRGATTPVDAGFAAQAAEAAAVAVVEEETPYALTAKKLEAFVAYQHQMNAVQAALLQELETLARGLDAGQPDGSKGAVAALGRSLKVIENKSRAEETARKALGLTANDVNRISRIATDVMSQRHMARLMKFDEELATLGRTRDKLPEAERAALDAQMERVKAQAATYTDLRDARREHGDANVDLALTREEALIRNYREMLEAH